MHLWRISPWTIPALSFCPFTRLRVRSKQRRLKLHDFARAYSLTGRSIAARFPIRVNSTFLLRSIRFIHGSDVLVAFRVLRKDDDGSITIAWKRLKQYPAPKKSFNRPVQIPQIQKNKWPTR